jgi:hypothetical protein
MNERDAAFQGIGLLSSARQKEINNIKQIA